MVRVYEIYKFNCLSFAASKSIESNGAEGGEGVSACKVVKKRIKPRQKCKTLQLLKRTLQGSSQRLCLMSPKLRIEANINVFADI